MTKNQCSSCRFYMNEEDWKKIEPYFYPNTSDEGIRKCPVCGKHNWIVINSAQSAEVENAVVIYRNLFERGLVP